MWAKSQAHCLLWRLRDLNAFEGAAGSIQAPAPEEDDASVGASGQPYLRQSAPVATEGDDYIATCDDCQIASMTNTGANRVREVGISVITIHGWQDADAHTMGALYSASHSTHR